MLDLTELNLRSRRWLWAGAALLLVAAILRIWALGREGLWCDEAYTALTIRLPLAEMITKLLRADDAPPLFYLLQKVSTRLAGDREAGVRALSAVAGIVAVAWLGMWPRRRGEAGGKAPMFTLQAGWSAAFMSIAAFGVFHARQARSYALLVLLATVFVLAAREMLLGRRRAGPLLAVSGVLLCLTHNVAVVLVLTSLVAWPLGGEGRCRLRSWILWHVPPIATCAILWAACPSQLRQHVLLNAWTGHYWQSHPIALAPLYSLGAFVPAGLPASALAVTLPVPARLSAFWMALSIALGLVCVAAGVLRMPRACAPRLPSARREFAIEAFFLAVPLLALLAASLVTTPVYIVGRTDVLAYPAFTLLVGRGLASLPRRLSAGALLFWFVISLYALAPSYGWGAPEWAKGTDRDLARALDAGGLARDDWIVHTSMTGPSIEYYLKTPHRTAWFPAATGTNAAADDPAPAESVRVYVDQAARLRQTMEDAIPEGGAAWVFGVIAPPSAPVVRAAGLSARISAEQVGYPMCVLVYALLGREPVTPAFLYRQDWVAGERVVLRIPRRDWVAADSLRSVDIRVARDDEP